MNRRNFSKTLAFGLGAAYLPNLSAATRNLKIGYTALSWNAMPRTPENLEPALKDMSELGFHSFETFAEALESWEIKGTLAELIAKYKIPLTSGYFTANVVDPAQRKTELEKVNRLAKVIRKHGGTFMVLAPNSVRRNEYKFEENKANIVAALNDYAKAAVDNGLGAGLHQHTGTAVETRDEVYTIMDSADTKYLKFAPDVGQLQKGGADAAKVVKDFQKITVHMHLKDFSASPASAGMAGYSPLGQGKVDLVGILDTMEAAGHPSNIMVELDRSANAPMSARETAVISKDFLVKTGYKFRT
jgi:inosose dehydratase